MPIGTTFFTGSRRIESRPLVDPSSRDVAIKSENEPNNDLLEASLPPSSTMNFLDDEEEIDKPDFISPQELPLLSERRRDASGREPIFSLQPQGVEESELLLFQLPSDLRYFAPTSPSDE